MIFAILARVLNHYPELDFLDNLSIHALDYYFDLYSILWGEWY